MLFQRETQSSEGINRFQKKDLCVCVCVGSPAYLSGHCPSSWPHSHASLCVARRPAPAVTPCAPDSAPAGVRRHTKNLSTQNPLSAP